MRSIISLLLLAWTAGTWFSGPYGKPFLGLSLFSINPLIPFFITLLGSLTMGLHWFLKNKENLRHLVQNFFKEQKQTVLILGLILLFHLVVISGPAVLNYAGENDSDSALHGLAGYHIAAGQERPMFVYGVHYVGSLKTHLGALCQLAFGKSPIYQRILGAFFFCGFLVGFYFFVRRLWDKKVALLATLLAAIPPYAVSAQLRYEEFVELPFWGIISLLLLLAITQEKKANGYYFFWYGTVLGLLFFAHPQAIFFIITGFIVLLAADKLFWLRLRTWLIPLGFIIGTFPTWVDSYFHDWVIFRYFFGSEIQNAPALMDRLTRGIARFYNNFSAFWGFEELYPKFFLPSPQMLGLLMGLVVLAFIYYIYISRQELASFLTFKNRPLQHAIPLVLGLLIFAIFVGAGKSYLFGPFRYIYLLWLVIPIIIATAAAIPKSKFGRGLGWAFFILCLTLFSLSQFTYIKTTVTKDKEWREWLEFCNERGITHFYGDFWLAYHTNFISKEEIIGSACFPMNYDPYMKYREQVDHSPRPPAYVFSPSLLEKAQDWATRFESALNALNIGFKKELFKTHIVYYNLTETLTPVQMANIQPLSPVMFKEIQVRKIKSGDMELADLRLVTIVCQNTGEEELSAASARRITEIEFSAADGQLIRKQPLNQKVLAGDVFSVHTLLSLKEILGKTLRLHVKVNDIIFSAHKKPLIFPATEIQSPIEKTPLPDINLTEIYELTAHGVLPEYVFSRGWGERLWESGKSVQWSGDTEMELLLPLGKNTADAYIEIELAPFADQIFEGEPQVLEWNCNGMPSGEPLTIKGAGKFRLHVKKEILRVGLNRFLIRPRLVEPICRSIKGDPGFVLRPHAFAVRSVSIRYKGQNNP